MVLVVGVLWMVDGGLCHIQLMGIWYGDRISHDQIGCVALELGILVIYWYFRMGKL